MANLKNVIARLTAGAPPTNLVNYYGPWRNGPIAPTYNTWTPDTITLETGAPVIQTEGMFNSFFRPITSGWFVGTLAKSETSGDWDDVKGLIDVKNYVNPTDPNDTNVGADPNTSVSDGPYNVVGVIGETEDPVGDYKLGYYNYNETTHFATPATAIVIWKDTSASWPNGYSNPSSISGSTVEAYLIDVQLILPDIQLNPDFSVKRVRGFIPFLWKKY